MLLPWSRFCLATLAIVSAAVDVEKTVKQVQSILQENVQLPRLTREEILQLLNDIKAEDAKSTSSSREQNKNNYISNIPSENKIENAKKISETNDSENAISETEYHSILQTPIEPTTNKGTPSLMVVLPYTPRDGSSLQELYTRPPRVEVIPETTAYTKANDISKNNQKLKETLKNNAKVAQKQKTDLPDELQAFLNAHGLKGSPGQDNFLLPLEGFKPLPPAKVIDGAVQLPENILLTYDLISSNSDGTFDNSNANSEVLDKKFLFEPIHSELPFELETSSSEHKKTILPLDLPKIRNTKSTDKKPNYEPIDYESIRVIQLKQGPSPIELERVILESDPSKRQTNTTASLNNETTMETKVESTSVSNEDRNLSTETSPIDVSASETDTGASIADLEDSFGGAAPGEPGDSQLPPPKKNGFYWMLDWNSFLEVGDGDTKVNIRFEPKLGDPQMFLPVNVP